MIIEAFGNLAMLIISGVVSMFPLADAGVLTAITTASDNIRATLASVNWIFPVGTFFQLVGFIIIIEGAYFIFRFVSWIIGLLTAGFVKP